MWGLLAGDASLQITPKASHALSTSLLNDMTSGDDTTTVGSGRSMSIFESFDDLCSSPPIGTAQSPLPSPSLPPVAPMAFATTDLSSILSSPPSPVNAGLNEKANAEASGLIKDSGRKGDLNACWTIWHRLVVECDIPPNEITLGCMVDALVSCREVRQAEALVNNWKHKVRPNTVVYSTLIHGWAKENDSNKALAIFEQMQRERVACNAVTYNCVIHACVRAGDMQGSLDLLRSMKQTGDVSPDKFTYSTIIKGYCGRGEMDSALFLFDEMLGQKLAPDLVIYNTLLDGCVKTRHTDVCDRLLEDMISRWRIFPNSYTLSIMIKRFGRQGDLVKALELVDAWPKRFGFRANAHVWTCLISACVTHGRLQTAECIFASMSGNDPIKMRSLLQSNVELSNANEYKLLASAVNMASSCPADAKTFETLAMGFLRFNDVRKALQVVSEGTRRFRRDGLSPQFVSQIVQAASHYGLDISQIVHNP